LGVQRSGILGGIISWFNYPRRCRDLPDCINLNGEAKGPHFSLARLPDSRAECNPSFLLTPLGHYLDHALFAHFRYRETPLRAVT
jgi:hypothetical protein